MLIHGAAGRVGTARLQLGRLDRLEMYGTCSSRAAPAVSALDAIPIDYKDQDFVDAIRRLTGDGVDVVFDPIGGAHLWQSRKALRRGGSVVGYGLRSSLRGDGLASGRPDRRQRFSGTAAFGLYIAGGWLLPGRKRVVPYSIQTLKRLKPGFFRQDLLTLFDLVQQKKIKPLIAARFPLAEARQAQELLAKGGVTGKIVLAVDRSSTSLGRTKCPSLNDPAFAVICAIENGTISSLKRPTSGRPFRARARADAASLRAGCRRRRNHRGGCGRHQSIGRSGQAGPAGAEYCRPVCHGSVLVAACVAYRAHYVDITGETPGCAG